MTTVAWERPVKIWDLATPGWFPEHHETETSGYEPYGRLIWPSRRVDVTRWIARATTSTGSALFSLHGDLTGAYRVDRTIPLGTVSTFEVSCDNFDALAPSRYKAYRVFALDNANPWRRYLPSSISERAEVTPTITPVGALVSEGSGPARSAELSAVQDLREWLGFSYEQIAAATGIGLRTIHHWRQTGATPRSKTSRDLWRLHSLARAVRRALGQADSRAWFRTGTPTPLDLLTGGQLEAAERRARRALFTSPVGVSLVSGFDPEPHSETRLADRTRPIQRAARKPRLAARRDADD